jgi:hypothetical protein
MSVVDRSDGKLVAQGLIIAITLLLFAALLGLGVRIFLWAAFA